MGLRQPEGGEPGVQRRLRAWVGRLDRRGAEPFELLTKETMCATKKSKYLEFCQN